MLELIQLENIRSEIETFRSDVDELLLYTKRMEVKNVKDAKHAIDSVAKSRRLIKDIDAKKRELTKKARDYTSKINNLAKDFLEPLMMVEDMIIQKFDHWKMQPDAEFISMDDFEMEIDPFIEKDYIRSELATATARNSYRIELCEPKLVPLEYMTLDEDRVLQAIKMGIREIPGVRIIKETKTAIRSHSL
ncbi:MAG: hypothetical protein IMZ64_03005 [Bacteroidetes bacterium]|nr:hypothetical protein [Bacteroidota bacterium]